MNAQTRLHIAQLQEWTRRFTEQKTSGIGAKQWCADHHLSYYAFCYWKRQVKEAIVDQVLPDIVPISFPEVSDQPSAALTIDSAFCTNRANHTIAGTNSVHLTVNGLELQLDSNVPDEFLAKLMKAVRYA